MRKEDRVIAAAAAAAKVKAGKVIDATAGLATAAVTKAAEEVHRAGEALNTASLKLAASVEAPTPSVPQALKLVD
ncbi:MAG TPA: hypothetical protein VGJ96_03155 [Gemmatimonadaceae bacterium]|jgi:hypothetical protein